MGKFPALGQRKPNIFEVNLVSALHHSLFKPSPHSLATHLSLLSPATHTHTPAWMLQRKLKPLDGPLLQPLFFTRIPPPLQTSLPTETQPEGQRACSLLQGQCNHPALPNSLLLRASVPSNILTSPFLFISILMCSCFFQC